jgi:hypothetical protein
LRTHPFIHTSVSRPDSSWTWLGRIPNKDEARHHPPFQHPSAIMFRREGSLSIRVFPTGDMYKALEGRIEDQYIRRLSVQGGTILVDPEQISRSMTRYAARRRWSSSLMSRRGGGLQIGGSDWGSVYSKAFGTGGNNISGPGSDIAFYDAIRGEEKVILLSDVPERWWTADQTIENILWDFLEGVSQREQ